MSENLLGLPNYPIARGLEFVALWTMSVFALFLMLSFWSQYRLLNTYDILSSYNTNRKKRAQVLVAHAKRMIFWVLGYQGEERERQSLDQLGANWIFSNFGKIFFRFAIFYFVYIWALILTTRALRIDAATGNVEVLSYTSKQIFGFFMIGVYIFSNSICDIFSIYFTVRHLEEIREHPRLSVAIWCLTKNLIYCFGFFLISQLVSNLIWPLKTDLDVPILDRLTSLAIALWPYAFILDASVTPPKFLPIIFPGQLLITGTVFLPTLVTALIIVVMATSNQILQFLKAQLASRRVGALSARVKDRELLDLQRRELETVGVLVTMAPDGRPVIQYRCINGLTVGIMSGLIATALWEWLKAMLSSV